MHGGRMRCTAHGAKCRWWAQKQIGWGACPILSKLLILLAFCQENSQLEEACTMQHALHAPCHMENERSS